MMRKPEYIACLVCGVGELRPDPFLVRCSRCDYVVSRNLFGTLRRIRGLSKAVGWNPKERRRRKPGERRRRQER